MLLKLNEGQAHWLMSKLNIFTGFHEWMHGMCPCQVEADFLDEDYFDAAA